LTRALQNDSLNRSTFTKYEWGKIMFKLPINHIKLIVVLFFINIVFSLGFLIEKFVAKKNYNNPKSSINEFMFKENYHLSEALEIIDKCYVEDVFPEEALIKFYHTIIKAAVKNLDSHTRFIEPEDLDFQVPLPTISKILNKDIGYIKIPDFTGNNRYREIKNVINEFKRKNVRGLVVDLRNNPGGLTVTVVQVADLFLEKNKLVVSFLRRKGQNIRFKTETGVVFKGPIVILINNKTASASEVLSGCLKNYEKAILVGDTTYGKGTAQIDFRFNDDSLLVLTVAKYYLPDGYCPEGNGLRPDILVKNNIEQLEKAIEILKK